MEVAVILRQQWGAKHGRGAAALGPSAGLVIHHAPERHLEPSAFQAEETAQIRIIEDWHAVHNKWDGIAYNFVVTQSGRVYEGRGWGRIGAHAGNAEANRNRTGVLCLIDGNRTAGDEAMWEALFGLIADGQSAGMLARKPLVTGHRDHRATDCPGSVLYAALGRLRAAPTPPQKPPPDPLADALTRERWRLRDRVSVPDLIDAARTMALLCEGPAAAGDTEATRLLRTCVALERFYTGG